MITGSSTSIPELEPLSIVTVEYQTVGERPITRAVTGSRPSGIPPWRSSLTSARSSLFSPIADSASATAIAQVLDLRLEILVLAPGLERLAEPVERVTERA